MCSYLHRKVGELCELCTEDGLMGDCGDRRKPGGRKCSRTSGAGPGGARGRQAMSVHCGVQARSAGSRGRLACGSAALQGQDPEPAAVAANRRHCLSKTGIPMGKIHDRRNLQRNCSLISQTRCLEVIDTFRSGGVMRNLRFAAGILSILPTVLGAGIVHSQNYPNKPIRMVTAASGGGIDFVVRLISPALSDSLGQQVIVDNRGGANGIFAARAVATAPPDGYTLLIYASTIWLAPFFQQNVTYDPVRDFAPITLATKSSNILVVHPSLPVRSVKELIALAKARPGELNYASASTGGSPHLAAELFKAMAGVNIQRIAYRGSGPANIALVAGEVQLSFAVPASVAHYVKTGRLRALAVTSAEPSPLAPGLPTVAAAGLPGYESVTPVGMFAPAQTPATLINRLNQEIVRVLNRADIKEKFFNVGVETVGSSPEQFAAVVTSDMAKWGKVLKDAGIRVE